MARGVSVEWWRLYAVPMTTDPKAHLHAWLKDQAYAPDDIVLSSHSRIDEKGLAALHRLFDGIDPGWRGIFPAES